jgi:replicative DNA helicase
MRRKTGFPHSLEAEQALLAALLLDAKKAYEVMGTLSLDDFYFSHHRLIFKTLQTMASEGVDINLVSVVERLKSAGKLEDAGGASYIASLLDVPSTSAAISYAEIIKKKSILRKIICTAREIANEAIIAEEPEEVLKNAFNKLIELASSKVKEEDCDALKTIGETVEQLKKASANPEKTDLIPTGFLDFDKKTGGLRKGELIVIAGRPSMGKTAFALNIAENLVLSEKVSVLFFSLEMSAEQLKKRILAQVSRVSTEKIFNLRLTDFDWMMIDEAIEGVSSISKTKLIIADSPQISPFEVVAKARKYQTILNNLGLIIVDYLQLMSPIDARRGHSRTEEISQITRMLKMLTLDMNIPVIVLSQLNRKVENREDKRPRLADLRDSGSIEQDADMVLFLYRDEVYNPREDNPEKGIAEVIIGKNRNGPLGTIKLAFLEEFATFESLACEDIDFEFERESYGESEG